ncbi:DUF2637 domain-containing protein [Streptomyces griseoluteus]|uniref:DUF2637 domain-containing protein n=1 Tax=Streptomyces griseoluteus TaxID=29306 RepID=UPI0033CA129F
MKTQHTRPEPTGGLGLAVGAAIIIVSITGIAFWLSYHHLHDVAAGNGLGIDPARAWAWPAVLDLFYLAGELLILRASYLRSVDPWAIALTAVGALGSITLNVAGVGAQARPLEYTVAAVPPVAALLAFGALMRQMHLWFARRPVTTPVDTPSTSVDAGEMTAVMERVSPPQPPVPPLPPRPKQAPQQQPLPAAVQQAIAPPAPAPAPAQQPAPRQPIVYSDPRCAAIRPLYDNGTRPGTAAMRAALLAAGHGQASDGTIRGTLRTEIERHEPELAQLPPAIGHTA